jgi:hypothetical protein
MYSCESIVQLFSYFVSFFLCCSLAVGTPSILTKFGECVIALLSPSLGESKLRACFKLREL